MLSFKMILQCNISYLGRIVFPGGFPFPKCDEDFPLINTADLSRINKNHKPD